MSEAQTKLTTLVSQLGDFSAKVLEIKEEVDKQKTKNDALLEQKEINDNLKNKTQIIQERIALLDVYNDLEAQLLEKELSISRRLQRIKEKYSENANTSFMASAVETQTNVAVPPNPPVAPTISSISNPIVSGVPVHPPLPLPPPSNLQSLLNDALAQRRMSIGGDNIRG
jgi:hypothetical protein